MISRFYQVQFPVQGIKAMESTFFHVIGMFVLLTIPVSGLAAGTGGDLPPARTPAELQGSIREVRVPDGRKVLAFTFDLCEGPREIAGFDAKIVRFLTDNSVGATFFAGGKWMRSHPEETMQLMRVPFFEIGTHGWDHTNFRRLSEGEAREQLTRANGQYLALRSELAARLNAEGADRDTIAAIPGIPRFFRFPYGACKDESLRLLAEMGMAAIQWNIVSGDPAPGRTARGIIGEVLAKVKPGSIVVFHANGKGHGTLGALEDLVPRLRSQGYEFVTVSGLLASGRAVSVPECYEMTPGDTARYDRLPGKPGARAAKRISELPDGQ